MTHDHYLQLLDLAKTQIAKRVQGLQPRAGNNVSVIGDGIAVDPIVRGDDESENPSLLLNIWVQITMTQSMTGVIEPPPPEYVENGVFTYPPFLVTTLSYLQARNGYTWENQPEVLPEAGSVSTPPGEFISGQLWEGDYFEGTAPNYDIEITDLQKTASIIYYLRGQYAGDSAFFDTDFNVGSRDLDLLLAGYRASPLPNEFQESTIRVGYSGTTVYTPPIPRGAYPNNSIRSVLSLTAISGS